MCMPRFYKTIFFLLISAAYSIKAGEIVLTPYERSGIYRIGERVGWTLRQEPPVPDLIYTLKRNGVEVVASGSLSWHDGEAFVAVIADVPSMLRLEVSPGAGGELVAQAGAAIAPEKLAGAPAKPADFDAFWATKISEIQAVPSDPVLTPVADVREEVDYATLTLANIRGARVHGQIAHPARPGQFPALLILQWAGGPYPLQKSWVTDRAAEGWLALNIMPHDLPCDMPKEFYESLPRLLKDYQCIGDDDRNRSYFLAMFLGAWRAADYLSTRSDWNGQTLVVLGPSMGGMQAFAAAALHPRVTHLIAHTPAGCDSLASLNGRAAGYPNWNAGDARVEATAPYFDPVNFAERIHARALVSMGFIDTVTPAAGIWMAFNKLAGIKEAVPMIDTPHGHQAKPGQEKAYNDRRDAWLAALLSGREPAVLPSVVLPRADAGQ